MSEEAKLDPSVLYLANALPWCEVLNSYADLVTFGAPTCPVCAGTTVVDQQDSFMMACPGCETYGKIKPHHITAAQLFCLGAAFGIRALLERHGFTIADPDGNCNTVKIHRTAAAQLVPLRVVT